MPVWTNGINDFEACEVCGNDNWTEVYSGRIRDGSVGNYAENGTVGECSVCHVQRLAERCTIPDDYYETDQYRLALQQSVSSEKAYAEQDWSVRYTHEVLWPTSVRGKTVADIGCGVGSFLDTCRGLAAKQIAVEPCIPFQDSLKNRGYHVFGSSEEASGSFTAAVDLAVSIQVIEHVSNPVGFLRAIRPLLKNDGELLITTPNRRDILRSLVPEVFDEFFYRKVHRWYFDTDSLVECATRSGYEVVSCVTIQKYGMANALQWLRDKKPKGFSQLPGIGPSADGFWKGYLQEIGQADTLSLRLRPLINK